MQRTLKDASWDKPYAVIGIIDAYGAIHHRPVTLNNDAKSHDHYWPGQTHKRWRLTISEWQLENSVLSRENKLTPEEAEDVYAVCRKAYTPPRWLVKGEEWEALGRPRSGKAYDAHCAKWDAIMAKPQWP
jgi:hypothetical protein